MMRIFSLDNARLSINLMPAKQPGHGLPRIPNQDYH
jgi:hypothetical protein